MIVKESIQFKRGINPRKSLNIGNYRKIEKPTAEDILELPTGYYYLTSNYEPFYIIAHIDNNRKKGFKMNLDNKWVSSKKKALEKWGNPDPNQISYFSKDYEDPDLKSDIKNFIKYYELIKIQKLDIDKS